MGIETALMIMAGSAAVGTVASAVQANDSARRAAHAQEDALKAQANAPVPTPVPVMPIADDKAAQAKRKQTIVAAQNQALLTGNNRAGTILTDTLGG